MVRPQGANGSPGIQEAGRRLRGRDKEETSLSKWTKEHNAKESDDSNGDASRSELYAQAKDHEIPGRSKMSKDELKSALKKDEGR